MSISNFIKRARDIMRMDAGINGDAQRIEQLTWMIFLKVYDAAEANWEIMEDDFESIIPDQFRWRKWANTDDEHGLKGDELLTFVNTELFPALKNIDLPASCPVRKGVVKAVFTDIHNYMKDGAYLRMLMELINEVNFTDPAESHAFGEIYETILKGLQSAGSAGEFYTPRALTDFMAGHVNIKLGEQVADFACGTGGFLNSARKQLEPIALKGKVEDREILSRSFHGIEKKPLPYLLCITNMLLNGIESPDIRHGNSLTRDVDSYGEKDKFDVILMNPPYGGSERVEIQNNFPSSMKSAETADLFIVLIMYRLKLGGRAAVVVPDGFLFGSGNKTEIKKALFSKFNVHTIIRLPTSVFSPYTSIATNIIFFDNSGENTKETWFYRVDMPEGYKHFSKTKPIKLEHLNELRDWWDNRSEKQINNSDKVKKYSLEEIKRFDYNLDLCGYPQEQEEILPPRELIERYLASRAAHEKKMDEALTKILEIIGKDHES